MALVCSSQREWGALGRGRLEHWRGGGMNEWETRTAACRSAIGGDDTASGESCDLEENTSVTDVCHS